MTFWRVFLGVAAVGFVAGVLLSLSNRVPKEAGRGPQGRTPKRPELPTYEVIEKIAQINGVTTADILIKSYSRQTPVAERAETAKLIAREEQSDEVCLFNSRSAQKAQYSDSFMKKNPHDYRMGYLGSYRDGTFTPGEHYCPGIPGTPTQ